MQSSVKHVSWFTSAYFRKAVQEGWADYMPTYYKDVPNLWENYMDVDVFYVLVSQMDQHGYFSFGLFCSESLTVKNKAKKIFLEVNPNMPRTHGQNFVHISEVDGLWESAYVIPELPEPSISDLDKKIGAYVAAGCQGFDPDCSSAFSG
jgi:acyl-CoA hydrolase